MWTKSRQSHFLVIQIKTNEKFGFSIPISLLVIDQIMVSLSDLVSFMEDILPGVRIPWQSWDKNKKRVEFKLSIVLAMVREILSELRSYGTWRMVEIDTEEAKVDIRFL